MQPGLSSDDVGTDTQVEVGVVSVLVLEGAAPNVLELAVLERAKRIGNPIQVAIDGGEINECGSVIGILGDTLVVDNLDGGCTEDDGILWT